MAQLTISDGTHSGLSRLRESLDGLGLAGLPGDVNAFAEILIVTAMEGLQKELFAGLGKETFLNRLVEFSKRTNKK